MKTRSKRRKRRADDVGRHSTSVCQDEDVRSGSGVNLTRMHRPPDVSSSREASPPSARSTAPDLIGRG